MGDLWCKHALKRNTHYNLCLDLAGAEKPAAPGPGPEPLLVLLNTPVSTLPSAVPALAPVTEGVPLGALPVLAPNLPGRNLMGWATGRVGLFRAAGPHHSVLACTCVRATVIGESWTPAWSRLCGLNVGIDNSLGGQPPYLTVHLHFSIGVEDRFIIVWLLLADLGP